MSIKRGGGEVFELDSVYREHTEFVYKYLFSLCHEEDTTEELLQETFYQALKSEKRYDGTCKVTTWLCQIAKHLWYQELERRKKYQSTVLNENLISEDYALEDKLCQREQLLKIFQKVHILDETSKEIFFLRVMGDFSFKEIGQIFNKNENWARVTFYRSKQKILKGCE